MSLELLGRVHKELSITGSALYEAVLAISERVNRKVQIIRLHWQASQLLERMEQVTGEVGQELTEHVSRRFLARGASDSGLAALDILLVGAAAQVGGLKQSLVHIDSRIRELKLEAIHQNLLRLQRDLSARSAAIERLTVRPGAAVVGHTIHVLPLSPSVHISTVLRGPFLLSPDAHLVFRPDDIVVLIGLQSQLNEVIPWFTGAAAAKVAITTPA
jgi:hypothetical protein